jgi:integrase
VSAKSGELHYGCGLRISEATQLKTSDIDRARMQLRVRNGKGAKGRVLPLSERLLKELVNYWRAQRQGKAGHDSPWLFLGKKAGQPMSTTMTSTKFLVVTLYRRTSPVCKPINGTEGSVSGPGPVMGT